MINVKLFRTFQFTCLFMLAPLVAHAAQADPCTALIPPSGAFQIVKSNGTHVAFNSAKAMYCSDDFSSFASSNNWNIGLDVPGYFSGNGAGNSQTATQQRQQFCGNSSQDLTDVDKSALYRMQGDSVISSAFVQCEKNRNPAGVYTVSSQSTNSGISLTITPNFPPSAYERITGIAASGATGLSGAEIAPGTALTGAAPVVGGYLFAGPTATFYIHTTAGDRTLTANKCLDGTTAGAYTATWTTTSMKPQSAGTITWTQVLPQAGCHPHCQLHGNANEIGDSYTYTFHAPAGVTLNNLQYGCQGGGCPYEDQVSLTLADPSTVVFHIRVRSEQSLATITAGGTHMVPVSSDSSSTGQVTYGAPFSIMIPAGATGAALSFNGLSVPLSGLATGPWNGTDVSVVDPGTSSATDASYTFKVDGPSCTSTAT